MKKTVQKSINENVLAVYDNVIVNNYGHPDVKGSVWEIKQLYHCQAWIIHTDEGYYLKSYNTIIAYTPGYYDIVYDFLRYVYGYTATSAQHISKFMRFMDSAGKRSYKDV